MPVAGPIIGAVGSLGAAALSKPKQAKDPNAYLSPYLKGAAGAAQGLFQQGAPQQFEGSTVAGFGGATQQAQNAILQRAMGGSPLVDQAQGFVQQGLASPTGESFGGANPFATGANPFGGNSNPYLDATFDRAAQKSRGALESEFARSGRNVTAAAPARADMLSSLATQIYAPAYESERNRQLQYGQQQLGIGATGFENQRGLQAGLLGYASPLAAQDYLDLEQARGVGSQQDALAQAQLSDQVNKFNYTQNAPQQNLDMYLQRLGGLAGKAGQPIQPMQPPNYGAAALGGAMLGQQLWPSGGFGRSPYTPYNGMGGLSADQALQYSLMGG